MKKKPDPWIYMGEKQKKAYEDAFYEAFPRRKGQPKWAWGLLLILAILGLIWCIILITQ